ncbi:MAG: response regulator [Rhodospirillaceae bacterium]|jgi:CheY-like chemotaxis protein|nr:response regulator [Rhodospirillaceae bacterium]
MTDDSASIRVLFVDDEEDVLRKLREQLIALHLGWDMVFVTNGNIALRQLEKASFDAIVSDVNNRHMPGEELMTRVHERFPEVVRIILSAEVGRSHLHRLADSDHFYLTKPVRPSVLIAAVEEAHDLHQALTKGKTALELEDIQDILIEFFVTQIRHQKLRLDEIPARIRPLLPDHVLDAIAPHYDQASNAGTGAEPDRGMAAHDDWLDITDAE